MRVIEKAIRHLLTTNPFYAHFFLNSRIVYDHPSIPTAAAGITSSETVIYFNTDFINKHTPEEVGGVVEHEVLHLLFDHVSNFNAKYYDQKVANIAMDCAINQYIKVLPKDCVTLDGLSKELGIELLPEQSWKYYYAQLMQKAEKVRGKSTLDVHISPDGEMTDGEGNPINKDLADAILKSTMDKAVKQAAGNLPQEVAKVYAELNKPPQINWKQLLRNFIAKSTSTTFRSTRKRVNRRFGLDVPGRLKKRELTLGVCVDSSGSVSDEAYLAFMAEIVDISKNVNTTYIIDADCQVQDVKIVKNKKDFDITRKGCGGTAYQPAISEALKMGCDAILYFGDFDSSDTPKDPHVPFLWVGVGNSPPPASFGSVIRING